ncbi:hypothetical protein LTR53_013951 [Teratosphaeriaceae sp. CCFEE 6253]|nr:hypothetical protein LTR53_013951 [Teratosphaeriaceae sp. CCFEE 6253]
MAENPAESSKAAKSFHFVPADGPSSHARQRGKPAAQEYAKEARRHVMRHIGHAKRNGRPPKRRTYERYELQWAGGEHVDSDAVALPVLDAPNLGDLAAGAAQYLDLDDGQVVARSDPHLPDLARSLGSGRLDPFLAYPFALSQQALRLLDYMLDPRVVILRSFRVTWYPLLGLGDPAVFNQCLSNTCSGIGKLLDIPSLFEDEATRYHAAALESVNSRINDPRHVGDDGILASVIGFAFHTEQTRRASSWSMHIRGLQGIVEARGGIDTVRSPQLRMMLFMVDTAGCAKRDLRPRFPLPKGLLPNVDDLQSSHRPNDACMRCLALWHDRFPRRPEIAGILRDLILVIQWVESESAKDPAFYFKAEMSGRWVAPLIHRCLQLPRIDEDTNDEPGAHMQEALRHACILFTQHVRRKFGIVCADVDSRVARLRVALVDCLDQWNGMEDMLRWVVFSGGLEATTMDGQRWFANVLATHAGLNNPTDGHLAAVTRFAMYRDVPRTRLAHLISLVSGFEAAAKLMC